jgi:CubicO group peptidase (beta-lactamase class C family)
LGWVLLVSKSFIALAVVRLCEEGRLSLDAPLRELAPEVAFTNPWEDTYPVRVAHLLEHTTGFDDLHLKEYAFLDGSLREALAVNPAPRTSRWSPGYYMAYSNGGYALAAYLIEKVTGERFEL